MTTAAIGPGRPGDVCPITREAWRHPVIAADGHIYERAAIAKWLESDVRSPASGLAMCDRSLVPAWHVMSALRVDTDLGPLALSPPAPSPPVLSLPLHDLLGASPRAPAARKSAETGEEVEHAQAIAARVLDDPDVHADTLLALARAAPPPAVQAWAAEALGALGTPRAAWHLLLLLTHPRAERRAQARFWLHAIVGSLAAQPRGAKPVAGGIDASDAALAAITLSSLPGSGEAVWARAGEGEPSQVRARQQALLQLLGPASSAYEVLSRAR